jgi:hypothetical protein
MGPEEATTMAATLTFYPRRALLEATVSGHVFSVPIHRDPTMLAKWEKTQERRFGKVTLWDHAFELPGGAPDRDASVIRRVAAGPGAMGIHGFTDGGARDAFHSHGGIAVYVGTRSSGIHIHGLPVCNRKTCIVVLQRWDDLRRAIAGENRLSFSVVV